MLAVDPCIQPVFELGLQQVEMLGFAHFQICCPRYRRVWVDQINRIKQFPAIVALIATGVFISAVGAGAFDVAIWQVAPVCWGIHLGL